MKKLLVSDYDDTFYINDIDILENIRLVNENKDKFMFVIATGRSFNDYIKKRDLYGIKSEYIIINHGASIVKCEELIDNIVIDNNIIDNLIKDLEISKCDEYFFCDGLISSKNINNNITKIHIRYKSLEETKEKLKELNEKYNDYINCYLVSKKLAIEIVSKKANKKDAILKIMKLKNIDKNMVYTIGNGATDVEMLKYFNGYQMENSVQVVKNLKLEKIKSVSELIKKISK